MNNVRKLFVFQQGNRSSSSACGSADVLEALDIVIELGPQVGSLDIFFRKMD